MDAGFIENTMSATMQLPAAGQTKIAKTDLCGRERSPAVRTHGLSVAALPHFIKGGSFSAGRKGSGVDSRVMLFYFRVAALELGQVSGYSYDESEAPAMYDLRRCVIDTCDASALHASDYCAHHDPDPEGRALIMLRSFASLETVKNVNAAGLRFQGLDLSGKHFYACSFSGAVLRNMLFAGCTFRMCFFDFCTVDSCDFSGIDAQFCSFAGSRFLNVSFENSELVHNNFDGIKTSECTFNYSNLYNSRFIMAEFEQTDFIDCNLKRTFIIPVKETEVSWRLSNTQESIRELDRIEL